MLKPRTLTGLPIITRLRHTDNVTHSLTRCIQAHKPNTKCESISIKTSKP